MSSTRPNPITYSTTNLPKPLTTATVCFAGGDRITGELDTDKNGDPFIRSDLFGTVPILKPSLIVAWHNREPHD